MDWNQRIHDVQKHLLKEKMDGWLLYDFHGINSLARDFLNIGPEAFVTRRFFYWIPAVGSPVKLQHQIEQHILHGMPGESRVYLKWQELETQLSQMLKGAKTVAMEFSPRNAIPYLSKIDAGTVDLIRSFGVEVVSSGSFLQYYTCVLDEQQVKMHFEAADFLDRTVEATWEKISEALRQGKKINEYQMRSFIAEKIKAEGFFSESLPICAVNQHSADPHYEPKKEGSSEIKRGDLILLDLWCKGKHPRAIYADITRVAVADSEPTSRQNEIFHIVRTAQKTATDFVVKKYSKGESLKGYEVDQVCRKVIEDQGYGPYFTHRTGHNIYTSDHGPGAHLDSLETLDLRELIPGVCFSIEPGIYLPNEFGIRLEYDMYLAPDRKAHITGGFQNEILCLL
jgi:Xaa-Pro dipeptidase